MKNIKDYKGSENVIHVKSLEEAKEINKLIKLEGGRNVFCKTYPFNNWEDYSDYGRYDCIVLDFPHNSADKLDFFQERKEYTIIEAKDFLEDSNNSLSINDLKEGEVYYVEHKNNINKFIVKFSNNPVDFGIGIYPSSFRCDYIVLKHSYNKEYIKFIRIATPEEKHWLSECEKANKFIDKETAMKTFNQPQFEKGKWYKDLKHSPFLYIKFDYKSGNDKIYSTERILNEKGHQYTKVDWWCISKRNWVELTDLSEIQKFLPDNHPDKIKSMSKEDLLAEAKRRFPKGTIFNNSNIIPITGNTKATSDGEPYYKTQHGKKTSSITDRVGISYSNGNMTIYKDGKWAEIIESKQPDLSELYNCYIPLENEDQYNQISQWLEGKGFKLFLNKDWNVIGKNPKNYLIISNNMYWMANHFPSEIKHSIQDLSKYGFQYNAKAEKPFDTSKKEEWIPKEGEWVKIVGTEHAGTNAFPLNEVFKVDKISDNKLHVYNKKGSNPKVTGTCTLFVDVRQALPHEIPTESKDLTGRWLKALKDEAFYIDGCKKGDYFQIINKHECKDKFNEEWSYGYDSWEISNDFELMAEGFIPTNTISTTGSDYGVISSTESIDVGDLVMIIEGKERNFSGLAIGETFIVEDFNSNKEFARPQKGISTGVHKSRLKLIKKAQTTTHVKKVDVVSPEVNNYELLLICKKQEKKQEIELLPIQTPVIYSKKVTKSRLITI